MQDKQLDESVFTGLERELILSRRNRDKSPVAAICSALGTAILIIIVVLCIPVTVPRAFGIHMYSVITGSMEPEIPTGSLVYVKNVEPESVKEDDVIAFYAAKDGGSIITHRVVSNSTVMGEFITKGDANKTKDMNPVKYNDYIGKMILSVPKAGALVQIASSTSGKIGAASMVGIGILLEIVASIAEKGYEKKREKKGRRTR